MDYHDRVVQNIYREASIRTAAAAAEAADRSLREEERERQRQLEAAEEGEDSSEDETLERDDMLVDKDGDEEVQDAHRSVISKFNSYTQRQEELRLEQNSSKSSARGPCEITIGAFESTPNGDKPWPSRAVKTKVGSLCP